MDHTKPQFTVIEHHTKPLPSVLRNLLIDTSPAILAALSEDFGLPRIPGLDHQALVTRLTRNLGSHQLAQLEEELIVARFGGYSVEELLQIALERDVLRDRMRTGRERSARIDKITQDEAVLIENGVRHWVFTMHGYDVVVNLDKRYLSCGCKFFAYASRRNALCKHIATAFQLIPTVYAREALIDLLVWREYGAADTPSWEFDDPKAA